MVNADSTTTMDYSNGEQNNNVEQKIPGGKQHQLPDEPQIPQAPNASNMGCASAKEPAFDHQNQVVEGESKAKGKQTKITQYYSSTENKGGHGHQNNINQSPKRTNINENDDVNGLNKRQKPRDEDFDSDDDGYTENRSRQSGSATRSSGNFPKIHDRFNDSDDEDTKSYSRYTSWAKEDIAEYRSNYPNVRDDQRINDNYKFYTNQMQSYPDGDLIDNIHKHWFGQYRKLEYHHGYIQWLFPLQEKGLNWSAEPLQKHEIELIKKDRDALARILKSYKLMLDFYGFELADDKTGKLRRSANYQDRFRNLNTSSHNYLRITRILKCLGEFDYEHLKFGFLEAILRECITENTLNNCLRSCKDYWIETLRSRDERRAIRRFGNDLIKYRNDRISLPSTCRAERPSSISRKQQSNPNE